MPPYFDEEGLRQLADGFVTVPNRANDLVLALLGRPYVSERAEEYAHHGVARRVKTLARCVDQIYRLIPPELDEPPDRDTLIDATIFVQAAVFNTFGAVDNLAFVWVNERGIVRQNGHPIPNGRIGLTPDKLEVRDSFSAPMRTYLDGLGDWFSYLESFRHSLGHRIPLYIPPHAVPDRDADRYHELEVEKNQVGMGGDHERYRQLDEQQAALVVWQPLMKHSWAEPAPAFVFHAQVLADFATIEEMSRRVLGEMDAPRP